MLFFEPQSPVGNVMLAVFAQILQKTEPEANNYMLIFYWEVLSQGRWREGKGEWEWEQKTADGEGANQLGTKSNQLVSIWSVSSERPSEHLKSGCWSRGCEKNLSLRSCLSLSKGFLHRVLQHPHTHFQGCCLGWGAGACHISAAAGMPWGERGQESCVVKRRHCQITRQWVVTKMIFDQTLATLFWAYFSSRPCPWASPQKPKFSRNPAKSI